MSMRARAFLTCSSCCPSSSLETMPSFAVIDKLRLVHIVPNPFFVADHCHDVAFLGGNARFDGAAVCHELLPEASDLFWFEHADCRFRTPEPERQRRSCPAMASRMSAMSSARLGRPYPLYQTQRQGVSVGKGKPRKCLAENRRQT